MSEQFLGRQDGSFLVDLHQRLALVVGELLADERVERQARGDAPMSTDEEVLFARQAARTECSRIARDEGTDAFAGWEESTLVARCVSEVLGLGQLQPLLDDEEISDIHVRGWDSVWVRLRNGRKEQRPAIVESDKALVELIRRMAARMGNSERRFDAGNPELNLQLPDGSRLFAVMEVSKRPSLIIRRHRFELSNLQELVALGTIDESLRQFFVAAVAARRNIVVAGGTGSGKTTLLRALINEVPREQRIVTIEDSFELGIDRFPDLHPDHDALQSRPMNVEGHGEITLSDLTRMALRMDPDRVIVGEVRGAEAFPMLMAMSQGNNGSMCTMHADSTRSVFPKLAAYVSMASTGLPIETVNLLISSAVHFVVYIEVVDGLRTVASVREVVDSEGTTVVSNEIFSRSTDGQARWAYPMRDSTRRRFAEEGFQSPLEEWSLA
jgi:Flp pilus assembly CpaF family ATPase